MRLPVWLMKMALASRLWQIKVPRNMRPLTPNGMSSSVDSVCVFFKKILPLRFGLMNVAVSGALIYFFVRFVFKDGIMPFSFSVRSALEIGFSFITINLLVQIVNLATERVRVVRIIAQESLLFLFCLANIYCMKTHVPPDFSLIADNLGLSLNRDAVEIIWTSFEIKHLLATFVLLVVIAVAEFKFKLISCVKQERPRLPKILFSFFLYGIAVTVPLQSYDLITYLAQDVYHDRVITDLRTHKTVIGYPYRKETVEISGDFSALGSKKPDIILVMIESFNANFIGARTPDGREITPVFNKLIGNGIYYDHFYGNSVQTCKGQAATLLSVTPSIKGKIFTHYPRLRFKALPSHLADAGYDAMVMQAGNDMTFDNTREFMKRAGFAYLHSACEFITKADRNKVWGWGVEDALLYQVFLALPGFVWVTMSTKKK